jgi:hypothetical protein
MSEANPEQRVKDLVDKLREYNVNDLTARVLLDNAGIMILTLLEEIKFQTNKAKEFERVYNNVMNGALDKMKGLKK